MYLAKAGPILFPFLLQLCTQSDLLVGARVLRSQSQRSTSSSIIEKRYAYPIERHILNDNDVASDIGSNTDSEDSSGSGGNHGDAGAFDDNEIPGLASDRDMAREYDGGDQKALVKLSPDAIVGLWQDALEKGTAIRTWLDYYVSRSLNRIDELPASQKPGQLDDYYKTEADDKVLTYNDRSDIIQPFFQVDATAPAMRGEYGLWNVEIYSRARQNTPQPPWFDDKCVVKLCVNFGRGVMVTMEAFKEYDDTPSAQRLKSSEISYQAWQAQAKSHNRVPDAKYLQYWQQHTIVNQESSNIMTLAHLISPESVDQIPKDTDGNLLYTTAGHGVWRPSSDPNSANGQIFNRLLSTPNVKPIVHMLADHNRDFAYPYPIAIHTFPRILERNKIPEEVERDSIIIVVLGEMPDDIKRISLAAVGGPGGAGAGAGNRAVAVVETT